MTYRELLNKLNTLSESQLDDLVSVELDLDDEILYPIDLRICTGEHDMLDENRPVLFVSQ